MWLPYLAGFGLAQPVANTMRECGLGGLNFNWIPTIDKHFFGH